MRARLLALTCSVAILAVGCTSTPSPEPAAPTVESASPSDSGEVAAAGTPTAEVKPWAAGVVPGGDGSGPAYPQVWPRAQVAGSGSSTSLTPILSVPAKSGLDGEVKVDVVDMSAGGGFGADARGEATEVVWSGQSRADSIEVPAGVLRQGGTYAWRATKGDEVAGPWAFTVDVIRTQSAPTDSLGGVNVNLVSGLLSTQWNSPTFTGAVGGLMVALQHQPSADGAGFPGLPAGWTWLLPGSGFVAAVESDVTAGEGDSAGPQSVVLRTAQGGGQTFVRSESGAYVPGLSDGTATSYGSAGTLARVAPGTWQFTAPDGTLVRFEGGRIASEWNAGAPAVVFGWDDKGRLVSLGDGVSRTMSMTYAGDGTCPASDWGNGFGVADGLWCATTNPDGSVTAAGYAGSQLGLIFDAGGVSAGFGWDGAGRLSSVRGSDAGAAAATAGGDWTRLDLTTQISYDGEGRVESITAPAASPGGDRAQRSYRYPDGGYSASLTASVIQANVVDGTVTPVGSVLGGGEVLRIVASADTWQVRSRTGVDGAVTEATYEKDSGLMNGGTDETGRTMQMRSDSDSVTTETIGPFVGSTDGAMRSQRILDATLEDPAAGTGSVTRPWSGLAATVWADGVGTPQWWDQSLLSDELSGSVGAQGAWNAVATGTWKVSESGTWVIKATAADGMSVDVTIDGVRCSSVSRECELALKKGDHALSVSLVGTGRGDFRVQAGRGQPEPIRLDDLRPDYDAATFIGVNDIVDGRNVGNQAFTVTRPWASTPDSVTASGGLTTSFSYEKSDPAAGSWGRQISMTTPSGFKQTTTYYGNESTGTDPCTGSTYPQAGQIQTITRYDGVAVTTVYDGRGNPVAVTTTGADGAGEQTCTSYDAAGRPIAVTVSTLSGESLTSTRQERIWADGQLTTTTTAEVGGQTYTTVSVTDVLGRVVSHTDAWGVVSTTAYSAQGDVLSRQSRLPGGDVALDVTATYEERTGYLSAIVANGTTLAEATYNEAGLLATVDYPGDVALSMSYAPSGAPERLRLESSDGTITQERTRNAAGRTLLASLDVERSKQSVLSSTWSYDYDSAGRLSRAVLESSGEVAAVGGKKRDFVYDYGSPEACPGAAGADFNRTGGSRDGVDFVTCYDAKGRLASTTDPHIVADGKADATYDGLGRLTELTGDVPLQIAWGNGTSPIGITQGANSTELTEAAGALIAMTVDGTLSRLSYANPGAPTPTLLLDGDSAVTEMLVSLPGGALARLTPGGDLSRVDHTDLFAAELTSTGPDGATIGQAGLAPRYGPFGEPLAPVTELSGPAAYGWHAQARNPSVGGWHDLTLTARPYHPWLGQFLAFDPVIGASTTGYGYGDGNPLDRPDYSGGMGEFDWLALGGGLLAAIGGVGAGRVAEGTSKVLKVGAVAALSLGSVAALAGGIGTWTSEGSSLTSSTSYISSVVAGIGLITAGVGSHTWYRNAQFGAALRKYTTQAVSIVDAKHVDEIAQLNTLRLKQHQDVKDYRMLVPLQEEYNARKSLFDAVHQADVFSTIFDLASGANDVQFFKNFDAGRAYM